MSTVLREHLSYLQLTPRTSLYREAVARCVRPGDVVADVGCGSGVLGLMCLEAGASRVYAIDSSDAIEIARETFRREGRDAQVTCIHASSFATVLPEQVDVVVCDHVGYFGFDYRLLETLADARRRWLKPGGRIIPQELTLQLGLVSSEALHAQVNAWASDHIPRAFHWVRELDLNSKHAVHLQALDVVSAPAVLAQLDLAADAPSLLAWTTTLTAVRDSEVHGLGGWFDCGLAPGVRMSNSPLDERSIGRSQAFLPLNQPWPVKAGGEIGVHIMVRHDEHLLAWQVHHTASGRRCAHDTWRSELMTARHLQRVQPQYLPVLVDEVRALRIVLDACNGNRTMQQIVQLVLTNHPSLFPSERETSQFVQRTLATYAQ